MTAKVSLDDQLLKQLQETGEVRVQDMHGVPIVLMTVDAREQLGLVYDDSEWTPQEMMALVANQLNDPQGWGHPEMEVYDEEYGHLFAESDGEDQ
jgi:hypothetical protein